MTPLLQALQAAAAVGFNAPCCKFCTDGLQTISSPDDARFLRPAEELPCSACDATGLDTSDPERLIGRAMGWLYAHKQHVLVPHDTAEVETVDLRAERHESYSYHEREAVSDDSQPHDGTETGIATALLRLVVRVGGKA